MTQSIERLARYDATPAVVGGYTDGGDHEGSGFDVEARIEWRREQSIQSRLCEYITGLQIEDPVLLERIITDHEIIRSKYGLPNRDAAFDDPVWYENFLHERARQEGVRLADMSDCANLSEESPKIGSAYLGKRRLVACSVDKTSIDEYSRSLLDIEHELIHAMQVSRSPSMPIEAWEYEAYIAGSSMNVLRENPEVIDGLFYELIGSSVIINYNRQSAIAGKRIIPVWARPEYFIWFVDGIDQYPDKNAAD